MCGIAGMFELDGVPASAIIARRMTETLAHRGPDGDGYLCEGPVALGHKRLAVIDLSAAGHQPMVTPDGRYAIVYNGEIFNFQELRAQLEALGHRFRSRTDTEVVLLAHAQWGTAAPERFNGMFAYALWDATTKSLLLVRDRYGIKPLYYAQCGQTLLFASEAKAVLCHPACRTSLDPEALVEYLTFQNILSDRTLFDGVRMLPPGSTLEARQGGVVIPRTYWDFQFVTAEPAPDPREAAVEVARLVRQAVTRQLVADVPITAYLSGGIDSGAIVAFASSQVPILTTITVGFDLNSASGMEIAFDERAAAEQLSYICKTEHYEMVLKAGDMERAMPRLAWHLEEPRVGQSYPNFYAAQLASKFGKVVLSGVGGDELFGGYPWRYCREPVNTLDDLVDAYFWRWQRLLRDDELDRIASPLFGGGALPSGRDVFRGILAKGPAMGTPDAALNASLYFELKSFLHGLLVMEDKLSMAHGLENRVPLLDNDLVDFALTLPSELKVARHTAETIDENTASSRSMRTEMRRRDGKRVLRDAMKLHCPPDVVDREKQGFSAPDASWFRGESVRYLERTLMRDNAMLYEFLDRKAVQAAVEDHITGRQNRRLLVWSLLSLEHWARTFLSGGRDGD